MTDGWLMDAFDEKDLIDCPKCNGSGIIADIEDSATDCPLCAGTGCIFKEENQMDNAIEHCRHWVDEKSDRCGKPASLIVWGALSDIDELGPKCEAHWPKWVRADKIDQYAVFDLRPIQRVTDYRGTQRIVIGHNLPITVDRNQ